MKAADFISPDVPAPLDSDSGFFALAKMQEQQLNHLPVVRGKHLIGLISDADLDALADLSLPLGHDAGSLGLAFVRENDHVFQAVKLAVELKLTVVPVVDDELAYQGSIRTGSLLQALAQHTAVMESGSIIVLEMNLQDFSLAEIARIIEADKARIMGCYVMKSPVAGRMLLTLKVNKSETQPIVASLERFNYQVVCVFGEPEHFAMLRERYDALMNYLKI
ncbi:MAG: CBS domain-containing protein [Chitinophagales bacterium]|nr:CBS domain-containing protein [Chitinophagales bacterium]MDW8392932.1 CBS domain-containing protein [Chitinophagales bacterium]